MVTKRYARKHLMTGFPPLRPFLKMLSKNDIFCFLFWIAILSEIQGCFSDKTREKSSIQKNKGKYFFGCVKEGCKLQRQKRLPGFEKLIKSDVNLKIDFITCVYNRKEKCESIIVRLRPFAALTTQFLNISGMKEQEFQGSVSL